MTHPMHRRDCSPMLPVEDYAHYTPVRSSIMLLLEEELARARSRQFQREAAGSVLARYARAARREQRRSVKAVLVLRPRALRVRPAQNAIR